VVAEVRVALLGAAGTIGPVIARDLLESDEVEGLLLLDRDQERLDATAQSLTPPTTDYGLRTSARVVDAAGSLHEALEGIDVLVNSASYRLNLEVMEACLEAGCHYIDLGGLYWMTSHQLALSERFERAGLVAILGIGSSPGKTNLMALQGIGLLDAQPEAIHVSAAGRDLDPPEGFAVPYALQTLLDEVRMAPVVVRDGRPVEIEPLSPAGTVDFGEPVGSAEAIHTLHSELRTFGESFGCREASFRLSLTSSLLSELHELSQAPEEEIRRRSAEAVPPSPRTVAVHLVDAMAGDRAVRVRAVTEPVERWGVGGGVASTAAPAAAAVRLLARREITARGALPPERCIKPHSMFVELERRGCRFETKVTEGVHA